MIKRLVKMRFLDGEESNFMQLFDEVQHKIFEMEGCHALKLVRDVDDPTIFFTISLWDSVDALDAYRASDLFKATWIKTKALFAQKAEAWSTDLIADING